MKTKPEIEELTALTLSSLDNLQAVEANPYLYTKVHQHMLNRQQARIVNTRLMLRLSAMLFMLLCINVTGIYLLHKSHRSTKPATGITAFSEAYFPVTDSYHY